MEMIRQNPPAIKGLRTLFDTGWLGGLTDGQLLSRFVDDREEAVFEAIVERHGPMVWGVCRRVVRDHHDAEDAFQATFMVLARKAATIMPRAKLGNWLYGVAYQTSIKTKALASRRRAREKQVTDLPEPEANREQPGNEGLPFLDRELGRLPDKYRLPIILCDLEGKTHRQAAEELGWPVGTVSGRLSRARAMLAERLTRRGVTLAVGSAAFVLTVAESSAGVPSRLVSLAARGAVRFATERAVAGVASTTAITVAQQLIKDMFMSKLGMVTSVLIVAALGTAVARPPAPARTSSPSVSEQNGRMAFGGLASPRPGGRDARDADEEMKRLEGTWAITAAVEGGQRATAEQKEEGLGRVVIKGGRMTVFPLRSPGTGTSFSIDVDPGQSPKAIGLILLNDRQEEEWSQPIRLGIYELKGDTLTICAGTDRPESFEVPPGSKRDLVVLRWARR